jgi:hypothetical protein
LTVPHVAPCAWHALGSGAGTHTFPTHCCVPLHVPQASVPPQPSEIVPQSLPAAAHVVVWHIEQVWVTASHAWPLPQPLGQDFALPHPSMMVPHLPVQSPGTQAAHWWVAPSQTCPGAHVPQATRFPHASPRKPHFAPMAAHTSVTHWCVLGSQLIFIVASHVPHASAPAQVESGPQLTAEAWQLVG